MKMPRILPRPAVTVRIALEPAPYQDGRPDYLSHVRLDGPQDETKRMFRFDAVIPFGHPRTYYVERDQRAMFNDLMQIANTTLEQIQRHYAIAKLTELRKAMDMIGETSAVRLVTKEIEELRYLQLQSGLDLYLGRDGGELKP